MNLDIRQFFQATNPVKTLDLENEKERKYYIDFSPVRGDQIIEKIRDGITLSPDNPTCQLFTGHIGCGKSTELQRLKVELESEGFHAVYFESEQDLDLNDVDIDDVLLAIARQISASLKDIRIQKPNNFRRLLQNVAELFKIEIGSIEVAVPGIGTLTAPQDDKSPISLAFRIGQITYNAKSSPKLRDRLRQYLEPHTGQIIEAINKELLEPAVRSLKQQGKKGLVVIIDNLDKISNISKPSGRDQPEYLFIDRSEQLRALNCHKVYTIPLSLRFSNDLIQRFEVEPIVLPMIPVQWRNGSQFEEGMALLRQMVLARAFPDLTLEERLYRITEIFDSSETLERLCCISGGHVRKLLGLLQSSLLRSSSVTEKELPISRESLEEVIREERNRSILGITEQEWELLRQVAQQKKIETKDEYNRLTRGLRVYEYRDSQGSWFDVDPILAESRELAKALAEVASEADREQEISYQAITKVQQFLKQTGAIITRLERNVIKISSVPGKLTSYTPLPAMFIKKPVDRYVIELQEHAAQLRGSRQPQTGLIFYQKQPDTLFRMRMAEVRLRDHFVLVPIPFAAAEQALIDEATSTGLLAQYAGRYLPGADLFDDRNAIGDTLSFYGRGNLLHSLEEDLRRCQGIGLFGIRKSGKTSVLLQLGFSMRQHPIVYIDLQPYGGKLRYGAELFNKILQKLSNLLRKNSNKPALSFDLFERDCPAKEIATDFTQQVCNFADVLGKAEYKVPIICFLDEIERILPIEADPKERVEEFNAFFGVLRELSQTRQCLSLLCADVHPDFNRINHWSQTSVPTNPVFQFFKEVFISPFSQEETTTMLTEIGQLMGVEFDRELLATIHKDSGGHPFIARQLASLLSKRTNKEKHNQSKLITSVAAKGYLNRPFKYLDILKYYFKENIWADLEKRNFASAMATLRLLACNEELAEGVAEEMILDQLSDKFTESECESALLWLENVGLIVREELEEQDSYRLQIRLLSRWLRREMKPEEICQWQIHSVTLD